MNSEYDDSTLNPSSTGDVNHILDMIRSDRWAGTVIERGLLPVVPNRLALPTASHDYDGCLVLVPGSPSTLYFGAVDGSGDPEWVVVAAGTP